MENVSNEIALQIYKHVRLKDLSLEFIERTHL